MIAEGYGDPRTLERRIQGMEEWLANPSLMEAGCRCRVRRDHRNRSGEIKEPLLCCPNDPDDVKPAVQPWPATRSTKCSSVPA
jgi:aconitate hydratase 2 / 2-methylisocitrate dehydratase